MLDDRLRPFRKYVDENEHDAGPSLYNVFAANGT